MSNIIIKGNTVDPNAELKNMGVEQDLSFGGQNTLLKQDKLRYGEDSKLRYYWFINPVTNERLYNYCLEGEKLPNGLIINWCGRHEALKAMIDQHEGKGAYDRGINHYRRGKRYLKMKELELIRNTKSIEDKLLERK